MGETRDRTWASDQTADWIALVSQRRDESAFAALFLQFAPKIKTYLLRHGLADQVAEELAQETLLAVWRKAAQYDAARASAPGWIYAIARNLHIDAIRRERCWANAPAPEPVQEPNTPEQELRACQGEQRIRQAMRSLPPEQAEVVDLSFFQEQSHSEISQHLGIPVGTVKSRIRLATAHLRSSLGDLA